MLFPEAGRDEERQFTERVVRTRDDGSLVHKSLVDDATTVVRQRHVAKCRIDEAKLRCKDDSAQVFCADAERLFWRRLGWQAGVLPMDVDVLALTHHNLENMLDPGSVHYVAENDFLQPPWEILNGEMVVKGNVNRLPFPLENSPLSKYAALFDSRSAFDDLRLAFLWYVIGKDAVAFQDVVSDVLDMLSYS